MLFEIRIHSRGGSGGKTTGQAIAETALSEKKWVQAYSEYGPERAGAPVQTYVKISDKKILSYSGIKHAEIVIILDDSLIDEKVVYNVPSTCIMIVNTNKDVKPVLKKLGFNGYIFTVDATKIALDMIGKNLPSLAIIGAMIKASYGKIIKMNAFKDRIKKILEEKPDMIIPNIKAVERTYNEVKKL
ncbi:MAG: 2-oxoacid:acceptor oxidoreductase family protein [Nanoarchaeota archaeon]|nr:2-oxoacid:acceptor oxidoreductase family protein [Nanoarchaeota archaeon]